MLKIIDTEKENDPNVFGEILREAFFNDSSSYAYFDLRAGFSELDKDSPDGKKLLSILGLVLDIPAELINDDVYWRNLATNNSILLSKTKMYKGPMETLAGWLWDGSGAGTLVLGEKNRFVINTDCRLDNNWRWCN